MNKPRLIDATVLTICLCHRQREDEDMFDLYQILKKMVREAPTIEAEPVRHGSWSHDCEGYVRCSICNEHEQNGYAIFCNYCPNCGAKMDGGADNV